MTFYFGYSGPEGRREETEADNQTTWTDYGKALTAGAVNVGRSVAGGTEYLTGGELGGDTSKYLDQVSKGITESTTPAFQRALNSSILPDEGEQSWRDVGIGRAIAAKAALATPSVAFTILPGGLLGAGLRAAGAGVGVSAAAGAGGAKVAGAYMNMGDVYNGITDEIDKLDDNKLRQAAPKFAEYIDGGMDPTEARSKYKQDVAGIMPALAGAVTMMTNGAEQQVARRIGGGQSKGFVKGTWEGIKGEGKQEMAEGGTGEFFQQHALKEAGLGPGSYNPRRIAAQTLEGGIIGGLMGGVVGGGTNIGGGTKPLRTAKQPGPTVEVVPELGPDQSQTQALTGEQLGGGAANALPAPQFTPQGNAQGNLTQTGPDADIGGGQFGLESTDNLPSQPTSGGVLPAAEAPSVQGFKGLPAGAQAGVAATPTAPAPTAGIANPATPPVVAPNPATPEAPPVAQIPTQVTQSPEQQINPAPVTPQVTAPPTVAPVQQGNVAAPITPIQPVVTPKIGPKGAKAIAKSTGHPVFHTGRDAFLPPVTGEELESKGKTRVERATPLDMSEPVTPRVIKGKKVLENVSKAGQEETEEVRRVEKLEFDEKKEAERRARIKAEEEEKGGRDHKGEDVQKEKKRVNAAAAAIAERHIPERMANVKPEHATLRKALRARLGQAVDEAKKEGIKLGEPARATMSGHRVWLREAYDLLGDLQKKAPIDPQEQADELERMVEFMTNEQAGKADDFKSIREKRKEETQGEEKHATVDTVGGEVEGSITPVEEETPQTLVEKMQEKEVAEEDESKPVPDKIEAPNKYAEEKGAHEATPGSYATPVATRVPVVEKRKDRSIKGAKGREVVAKTKPKEDTIHRGMRLQSYEEIERYIASQSFVNEEDTPRTAAISTGDAPIIQTTSVRKMLPDRGKRPNTTDISSYFEQRVRELSGDTPIHIVSDEDMRRLVGDEGFTAYYNYSAKEIVMAESMLAERDDQLDGLIVHEATHAIAHDIINSDPELHKLIDDIRQYMITEWGHAIDIAGDTQKDKQDRRDRYGLTDNHEFISELWGSPRFRTMLAQTPIPPSIRTKLSKKLGPIPANASLWELVVNLIRHAMRLGYKDYTALDAAMRLSLAIETRAATQPKELYHFTNEVLPGILNSASDSIGSYIANTQQQTGAPWALKTRLLDSIATIGNNYFTGGVIQKISDIMNMIGYRAGILRSLSMPLIREGYNLRKQFMAEQSTYDPNRSAWDVFVDNELGETSANLDASVPLTHANNKHLGKNKLGRNAHNKAQWERLNKMWQAMPPELKAFRVKATTHFRTQQNAMSLGLIKNALRALGISDDALANRIHTNTMTDADKPVLEAVGKGLYSHFKNVRELAKIDGIYWPLMRRGDHVINATYKVTPPSGAKKISEDERQTTFEFTTRAAAMKYAADTDLGNEVKSVWVDENTGKPFIINDYGEEQKVRAADTDSVQRFWVVVDTQHTEFFNSKYDARNAYAEYSKDNAFSSVGLPGKRQFEPSGRSVDMMSAHMRQIMEKAAKGKGFENMSEQQKHQLARAFNEVSLTMLGSTRIQSRRAPRRYVRGASRDFVTNINDYSTATAGYLAKLELQPQLEEYMKDARAQANSNYTKDGVMGRTAIMNELEDRVWSENGGYQKGGWLRDQQERLLLLSFADKLGSVMYSVVNATQQMMLSYPVLAARFGPVAAMRMLAQANNEIGFNKIIMGGVRNTKTKLIGGAGAEVESLFDMVMRGTTDDGTRRMFQYLVERNSIDPNSGLEMADVINASKAIDKGLGYLSGVLREMPKAVEVINRMATAKAAYMLEMQKNGGDWQKATEYAQRIVNETQFNYDPVNMPKFLNHPLGRLVFQFKKYPVGIYHLIGMNIGRIISPMNPGERSEAIKVLAGVALTHMAMAGALGLPTEPFKWLLMGAKLFNSDVPGWDDIEDKIRQAAADTFGKTAGEVLTKGLPRLLGIDFSTRVGMDNLFTFGSPNSWKREDFEAWAFRNTVGAPIGLPVDWGQGISQIFQGKVLEGAEKIVPLKQLSDIMRAYRQGTEGKKNSKGELTAPTYTPYQAAIRALGATPASEAERFAMNKAYRSRTTDAKNERTALQDKWMAAKPADKAQAWKNIQSWNKGKPEAERLTMGDLEKAKKRRESEKESGKLDKYGVRIDKRSQQQYDQTREIYNP